MRCSGSMSLDPRHAGPRYCIDTGLDAAPSPCRRKGRVACRPRLAVDDAYMVKGRVACRPRLAVDDAYMVKGRVACRPRLAVDDANMDKGGVACRPRTAGAVRGMDSLPEEDTVDTVSHCVGNSKGPARGGTVSNRGDLLPMSWCPC